MYCKPCSHCRQLKSLEAFDHSRKSRDNRHHRCKTCERRRDKERLRSGSLARSIAGWYKRHPEALEAHRIVRQAIRRGELRREPCCMCGCAKSHAHHDDYGRPLDVVWLCVVHHAEHHRFLRFYGIGQGLFEFIMEGRP